MTTRIEKSRNFFLLKDRFKSRLSGLEKNVLDTYQDIDSLEEMIDEMKSLAADSPYFERKMARLNEEFGRLISIKKYNQSDFNRIFNLTDHLEETEKARFLSDTLRGRIEQISRSMVKKGELLKEGNIYTTFSFREVHFITDARPVKIVKRPDPALSRLTINGSKYDIFPSVRFGLIDNDEEHFGGNVLVARKNGYRCFRFDTLGREFVLKPESFNNKLVALPEKAGSVTHFLKRGDIRYYYLP